MIKLLLPIFIAALLANIVAFWIKGILKRNNYVTSYISGYFTDTINIFKLAKVTRDKNNRMKYLILAYANVGLAIISIAFVIILIANLSMLNDLP